ncbi:hypothetical protein AURDEDRAFT_116196 [Auricularia subglabra TFB-10046 SS5]|nr:hypothetical protein AURDEDRAFT_116196 [Auricularia subglabra TFB-10046 SS5]
MASLSRRTNYFKEDADVYDRVAVAFDGLALVLGIVLSVLAIIALSRSRGHWLPFIALLFGMTCYILSHALDIAYRILNFDPRSFDEGRFSLVAIGIANSVFVAFTDILLLLAVFLVLWKRQSFIALAHPAENPNSLKRVLDIGLIACMFILTVAIFGYIGNAEQAITRGLITLHSWRERYKTFLAIQHLYAVFYFLTVVDITATAILLKSKVLRLGFTQGDKATNAVLFYQTPLLSVHWFWYLFQDAWFAARLNELLERTPKSSIIVSVLTTVEVSILPACIGAALILLGIRRTMWNTFGDKQMVGGSPARK